MVDEIHGFHALETNRTWGLVPRPHDVLIIGSKWVYTIKVKPNGSLDKNKAYLVAQGYKEYWSDYKETFSPVTKIITVCIFLAIGTSKKWSFHQIDVKNAFLYGNFKKTIYMEPFPRYYPPSLSLVCKLRKSLYGLKQAPWAWFEKFHSTICFIGF